MMLPVSEHDAREARGLTDAQLRERIIEMAARIDNSDGGLTAESSMALDLAGDLLDAALNEWGWRWHQAHVLGQAIENGG